MSYPGIELDAQAWQLLSPADYINPTPQAGYHLVVVGCWSCWINQCHRRRWARRQGRSC
jgi:hypothetical protein